MGRLLLGGLRRSATSAARGLFTSLKLQCVVCLMPPSCVATGRPQGALMSGAYPVCEVRRCQSRPLEAPWRRLRLDASSVQCMDNTVVWHSFQPACHRWCAVYIYECITASLCHRGADVFPGLPMTVPATRGAMEATASGCQFCTVHG